MKFAKTAMPYAVLFLLNAYWLNLELLQYLALCALLVGTQVTDYFAGYKQGFRVAQYIGIKLLVDLKQELGADTMNTAMDNITRHNIQGE